MDKELPVSPAQALAQVDAQIRQWEARYAIVLQRGGWGPAAEQFAGALQSLYVARGRLLHEHHELLVGSGAPEVQGPGNGAVRETGRGQG